MRRLHARLGVRAQSQRSLLLSLYEQASALDLPICVHSANGAFTTYDFFADDPGFNKFNSPSSARFIRWCFTPSRSVSRS